jgi:hypothetical protein
MPASEPSLRWGPPDDMLELISTDAALLEQAAVIFRGWPPVSTARRRQWRIVRCEHAACDATSNWTIQSTEPLEVTRCVHRDLALWLVECSAQEAFVDAHPGAVALHGALLAKHGRAVLVLGAPETGKSTLAHAMWERGWSLLSDDMALADPQRATARPTPRRVRLRASSLPLLDPVRWQRIVRTPSYTSFGHLHAFRPSEIDAPAASEWVGLDALICLGRPMAGAAPAALRPIPPALALLAILPYSLRTARLGLDRGIARVLPLAEAVPAYDLSRGPLDAMTNAIDGVIRP